MLRSIVERTGFELVDVRLAGPASRRVVKLRVDVPGGGSPGHGVTTDDCVKVSRAVETTLEQQGMVGPQWLLEVSSPGIERPVRFVEHWRRYVGREVRVRAPGLRGTVVARVEHVSDQNDVTLMVGNDAHVIALDQVRDATLVADWSQLKQREK